MVGLRAPATLRLVSVLMALSAWTAPLLGCGDDLPSVGARGTSTGLPAGDLGTDGRATGLDGPSTGPSGDSSGTAQGADTGFDPPRPACGNGFVERDEQCDDGNRVDGDDCNNVCQTPCGLDFATVVLPPTDDSVISADDVAASPGGGAVVVGLLRRITTDQRGNEQIDPDVAQVLQYEDTGTLLWSVDVGSPGVDLTPAGVVVSQAGAVTVAATVDTPQGGRGIVVVQLDGADGTELWRHVVPGSIKVAEDLATGIAITADDDVVVSGQVRVAEGDDDIWVRKLSGSDGLELWSSSYSGTGGGGFSTDDGGPVAVDAQGRVWVLGLQYEDFQTRQPVLLRFGANGGPAELAVVQVLRGALQEYYVVDLVAGEGDTVHAVYGRVAGGAAVDRLVRYEAGQEVWARSAETFEGTGSGVRIAGIAVSQGELVVAGTIVNDVTVPDSPWNEVWISRVQADAAVRCRTQYRGQARGLVPPSITAADTAVGADASAVLSGLQVVDGDVSLWLGRFRPQ